MKQEWKRVEVKGQRGGKRENGRGMKKEITKRAAPRSGSFLLMR